MLVSKISAIKRRNHLLKGEMVSYLPGFRRYILSFNSRRRSGQMVI
ncbi:MAG: hypothetical protein ACRC1Z_24785 [Waterburya sp.]